MNYRNVLNHLCFLFLIAWALIWAPVRAGMNVSATDMVLWLDQGLAHYCDLNLAYNLWFIPMAIARSLTSNLHVLYAVYAVGPVLWAYAIYLYFSLRWKKPQAGILLLLPLATSVHVFFDAGHPVTPMLTALALAVFWAHMLWTNQTHLKPIRKISLGIGVLLALFQAIACLSLWPKYSYPTFMHESRAFFKHFLDYITGIDPSQYLLLFGLTVYVIWLLWMEKNWKLPLVWMLSLGLLAIPILLKPAYIQEFEARLLPLAFCIAVMAYLQSHKWHKSTTVVISFFIFFFIVANPLRIKNDYLNNKTRFENMIKQVANKDKATMSIWSKVYNIDALYDPSRLPDQSYLISRELEIPPCFLTVNDNRQKSDIYNRVRPYQLLVETYCGAETYRRDFGLPYLWDDYGQNLLYGNVETQQNFAAREGSYGVYLDSNYTYGFTINLMDIRYGDSIHVSVYRRGHAQAHLIVSSENSNQFYLKEQTIGELNQEGWQYLETAIVLDRSYNRLRFYVWNADPLHAVSFDDFTLKLYRD